MSRAEGKNELIQQIEVLMLEHFCTEPFHNLLLMFGPQIAQSVSGGTCSDKTLSFITAGKEKGFDITLHSGFIGGQEIHRLASVRIGGSLFFADVGNGWPSVKLYPTDREVSYRSFGMGFRTEMNNGRVSVYHERRGSEELQLEIDSKPKSEAEIRSAIERRFQSGIKYPFSNSLRFSRIVGERFLFLRGNHLEIYTERGFDRDVEIQDADIPRVLSKYFGCDLHLLANLGADQSN